MTTINALRRQIKKKYELLILTQKDISALEQQVVDLDTIKIEYLRGKVGKIVSIQRNIAEDLIERGYAKEVG